MGLDKKSSNIPSYIKILWIQIDFFFFAQDGTKTNISIITNLIKFPISEIESSIPEKLKSHKIISMKFTME